jgi:UTP:GlnB (protein PII) uridylyltransferase
VNSAPPHPDSKQSLRGFVGSMPAAYRDRFAPAQMAVHAHVSAARGARPAHVGSFPWHDPSLTALCVVADDRPGLLALISEAFVQMGLDIQAAEAYTRRLSPPAATEARSRPPSSGAASNGTSEVVDLFWVRRPQGGAITESEVDALRAHLVDLLLGRRAPTQQLEPLGPADFVTETTVRFIEGDDGLLNVLEVETDDRSGLLYLLSRALFELQVQITTSQVRTTGKRVYDRFTLLELDGSPIDDSRRLEIQVAVLSAIEPMTQIREIRRAESSPS